MSAVADLRDDRRRRLAATGVAVALGLALAVVHWTGLLLAGALVAFPQRSLPRGVAAGVGFGGLAVVAFLARFALAGTLAPVLATGQPAWLAVGLGLGLPAFGSLARALG